MKEITVRKIKEEEYELLKLFIYYAIFQEDSAIKLPFEVIYEPNIYIYIDNFGQINDNCLVVELDSKIVGMCWTRILNGDIKGFGYIDEHTPEFAISVLTEYQNKGLGSILLKEMLLLLQKEGYWQASLAVQKENYAFKMYQKFGFEVIKETQTEYIMKIDIKKN